MKRILFHVTCHGIALALIITAGITGYIYLAPVGFLFELIFWFYALSLARKRKLARMNELFGSAESNETSIQNQQEAPNKSVEDNIE